MNRTTASRLTIALLPILVGSAGFAQNSSSLSPTTAASSSARQLAAGPSARPLSFEPNRGQTDAQVQFIARGADYTLYLSPSSATFQLRHRAGIPLPGPHAASVSEETAVVRMVLRDANATTPMQAEDRMPGIANYMGTRDQSRWITGLPTYARARAAGVYPGIDLVYYGTQGQLEYDFVVAPQADPGRIHFKIEGATPAVDASGDLLLNLLSEDGAIAQGAHGGHNIRFQKPLLYQDVNGVRNRIDGAFAVAKDEVTFRVGDYDRSRPLVIDPLLAYSSYLGGSSQDSVPLGLAMNAAGDLYLTGRTFAVNYPTTAGVISPHCPLPMTGVTKCGASSESAAFISKIAANGQTLIYSTYLGGSGAGPAVGGASISDGGSGADFGTAIAVDPNDNVWVTGVTYSNNFPITSNAFQVYCSPAAKDFNFSTLVYEGTYSDCARFNSGREYVYGAESGFLVKINPTGTQVLYGTFLGGSDTNQPQAVALDTAGNVYVAGETSSFGDQPFPGSGRFDFPTTGNAFLNGAAYDTGNFNFNSGFVGFLSKFSPDGQTLLYSTLYNGSAGGTWATNLAVTGIGKATIAGFTLSANLPTAGATLKRGCPVNSGNTTVCAAYNGFVASFDTNQSGKASLVYATYLAGNTPGNADNYVSGLASDSSGNLYLAGPASRFDFPTTSGVLQPACNHSNNGNICRGAFVTKLSAAGQLQWSTFYTSPSSNGNSSPPVLAIDPQHNVYISANDDGGGDIPLANPFQAPQSGFAYITELSGDGKRVVFGSYYGGGANIEPTGIAVDAAQNIYLTGYTTGLLPLVDAYQSTNSGGFNEGFFAKVVTQFQPSSTALTVTPATAGMGAPVTLKAHVTGKTGFSTPTGNVKFLNGTALLGTGSLDTGGSISMTKSTLPAGTYKVVASYSGDGIYGASNSAAVLLTITKTAAAPAYSPSAGTFTAAQTVTISDATAGSLIYYTTNGTAPTTSSAKYTGPIKIVQTETLKAIAVASGYLKSQVSTAAYTITPPAATPVFKPAAGSYAKGQLISITDSTAGSTIYYTLQGATPTTSSTKYTAAIPLTQNVTIKAIAVAPGSSQSATATAAYTVK